MQTCTKDMLHLLAGTMIGFHQLDLINQTLHQQETSTPDLYFDIAKII